MKKRKKLKITPMKIDKEVKDEKPELMMLFEKMKRNKIKVENEKKESRIKKTANDENIVLNDEKKPPENIIDENMMKIKPKTIVAGQNGKISPKNRTFGDICRLKNQFSEVDSLTTKPREGRHWKKFSKRKEMKLETNIAAEVTIAGNENDEKNAIALMSSPGKRKLDVILSKSKTSRVKELIDNFEVGNPTKRKKVEREISCSRKQPHLNFNFKRGNTENPR